MKNVNRSKRMLDLQQSKKFATFSKKKVTRKRKKNIDKFKKTYEGVLNLGNEMPKALFIIGLKRGKTALKEAKDLNIPIIAICNTDGDPDLINYLIPGNDHTEKSVSFLVNKVTEIIRESKLRRSNRLSIEESDNAEETTK